MSNLERIKNKIAKMSLTEFIEFCGDESCENIICNEIRGENAFCRGNVLADCGECLKHFLESEVEGE